MEKTERFPNIDRQRLWTCLISTLLFWLVCHGYRIANASFSGDGTLIFQAGEEIPYQISLGRFLQPVWWQIRGAIVAPYLIGLFCLVFLTLSGYVLTALLRCRRTVPIVFTCGVLTASKTLGLANATFIPWSDVYTVALFFALLGAACSLAEGRKRWLAPLFYVLSLGMYQSYLTCAASVVVIVLLAEVLSNPAQASAVWKKGMTAIFLLVVGLGLYAVLLKAIFWFGGIDASQDYNGVGRVGLVSLPELLRLASDSWLYPIRILLIPGEKALLPWHVSAVPQFLNILILISCVNKVGVNSSR